MFAASRSMIFLAVAITLSFGACSNASAPETPSAPPAPTTSQVAAPNQGTRPDFRHLRGWEFNPARSNPVPAEIRIKVNGLQPKNPRLLGWYGNENYLADNTPRVEADGTVVFAQDSGYLSGMYFAVLDDQFYLQLLLDEDQTFRITTSKAKPVADAKVQGNIDTELLYESMRFDQSLQADFAAANKAVEEASYGTPAYNAAKARQTTLADRRDREIQRYVEQYPDAFFPKFKVAGQNPRIDEPPRNAEGEVDGNAYAAVYRRNFWDGVDFGDVRLLRTPVLHNKLKRYMKELTPQTPDSIIQSARIVGDMALYGDPEMFRHVVNWIAVEYEEAPIMGAEAVFVDLVKRYFSPRLAFWDDSLNIVRIQNKAAEMEPSLLGKTGQDLRAKDVNGQYRSLYELDATVRVVFIYSYSCEHCQEAAPEMANLYREWKPRGVEFYGLATDQDVEPWKKFVADNNLAFVNVIDPTYESKYYQKYHIDITPEIYVLDRNNTIVAKNLKPFQLPDVLEKHL